MRLYEFDTPAKKTLYVSRRVLNAADLLEWARREGFNSFLTPEELHITLALSRKKVDWITPDTSNVVIKGGARTLKKMGKSLALTVESPELQTRWQEFIDAGCSWDHPSYLPHVTLTYNHKKLDIAKMSAYKGDIILGAELFRKASFDYTPSEQPIR